MMGDFDMGYRSQVGYLIVFTEKEVYDQFKVQYKLDPEYEQCRIDEPQSLMFNDDKLHIRFEAEDVKWYDSFPDVTAHHKLLDLADEYAEKYNCVSWCFVRIGEETGDIETRYGGDGEASSMIYPVSSICFDGV
jgi:hypothetical protein